AVIIIESGNLNDSVTVPEIPEAANKGNRLYLCKGEKINLSSLLEGIIVYNANDAAIAAAKHIAGSEKAFVDEMNARAKDLGMT
ncbi:serine-type D-Ala-D-Ala carboxypeptidase, partial [Acinetobacter baumannii]|nr:serine-type D-Ala-D-Ala carboxypeptidase [Acinetobacter baumannii]